MLGMRIGRLTGSARTLTAGELTDDGVVGAIRARGNMGSWNRLGILLAVVLAGCATEQQGPSYQEQLNSRPAPRNDEERQQECSYIRSEIARQNGLAGYGATIAASPAQASLYRALAQQNIAALESRAANMNCRAAFSPGITEPREMQAAPKIRECISACKENTQRTSSECFDACNK